MTSTGPGAFFARHRAAFATGLSLAATAGAVLARRGFRSHGFARLGWMALAALQGGIVAGMATLRRRSSAKRTPA